MMYLLFVVLEIVLLFFLSQSISKSLSRFLPVNILSFLFLPGVIIHELSHLLVAGILFVKVGEIEFAPKVIDEKLKLGSVKIEKTDPVRRAIIGFAPVFVGFLIIFAISYFFSINLNFFQENQTYIVALIAFLTIYILFAVSNTMFSSSKDMEGTLELLGVVLIIFIAFYFIGFRFPAGFIKVLFSEHVINLIQKSSVFLLVPIIIDSVILGTIKIFKKVEL